MPRARISCDILEKGYFFKRLNTILAVVCNCATLLEAAALHFAFQIDSLLLFCRVLQAVQGARGPLTGQ